MSPYFVRTYQPEDFTIWNQFLECSKNATFLFQRDFMEYHGNRFHDFSLLIFDENKKLCALFPAHKDGDVVFSHQGLSYGGLIYSKKCSQSSIIKMFKELLKFLSEHKIRQLNVKLVPYIYNTQPADEFSYALCLANARLVRRDSLCVIDLRSNFSFNTLRKRKIKLAIAQDLKIVEESHCTSFWNEALIPLLQQKYGVEPIHSVGEINFLKTKFPQHIRQFNVYKDHVLLGGTTIFETETLAHVQYIAVKKEYRHFGALDYLFHHLIHEVFPKKKYFDLGSSNEENGRKLNEGLILWKESFGGSTVAQDFYEVDSQNFCLLNDVFV